MINVIRTWWFGAIAAAIGIVAGLPMMAYVLIYSGFWMGLMWLVWVPAAALAIWDRGTGRIKSNFIGGFVSAVAFALVLFWLVGLEPGEGSPVIATAVGAWMVLWIAAALLSLYQRITRPAPARL